MSVLLLSKIATVTRDFRLNIEFVISFHLTLSDFCLKTSKYTKYTGREKG